jgi:hypothetical protein
MDLLGDVEAAKAQKQFQDGLFLMTINRRKVVPTGLEDNIEAI